jgi:GDPmannose 4,6-dehydratase
MKAFITGISGQDGYYLSKFLLEKNYEVHGTVRRSSLIKTDRIDSLISKYSDSNGLHLHYSDQLDSPSLTSLVDKIEPEEIYNLAAQSHVAVSFQNPQYSSSVSTEGSITLLEAIRKNNKEIKFYQASSSEMFGGENEVVLNEESKFYPKSPYAAGKLFAHNLATVYRESYGLFASNGILFNHESPHRGETFVTRKITRALGRIKHGLQTKLTLGNLESKRDWGYAGDYVEGMWKILQHNTPDDFVLATGESYSVRDFLETAFSLVDLSWEDYVVISERYQRPNEVNFLKGDYSKAKKLLNWEPKTTFFDLVKLMVEKDLELANREKVLIDNGLIKPTWEV